VGCLGIGSSSLLTPFNVLTQVIGILSSKLCVKHGVSLRVELQ
jgi:hypothetical protein